MEKAYNKSVVLFTIAQPYIFTSIVFLLIKKITLCNDVFLYIPESFLKDKKVKRVLDLLDVGYITYPDAWLSNSVMNWFIYHDVKKVFFDISPDVVFVHNNYSQHNFILYGISAFISRVPVVLYLGGFTRTSPEVYKKIFWEAKTFNKSKLWIVLYGGVKKIWDYVDCRLVPALYFYEPTFIKTFPETLFTNGVPNNFDYLLVPSVTDRELFQTVCDDNDRVVVGDYGFHEYKKAVICKQNILLILQGGFLDFEEKKDIACQFKSDILKVISKFTTLKVVIRFHPRIVRNKAFDVWLSDFSSECPQFTVSDNSEDIVELIKKSRLVAGVLGSGTWIAGSILNVKTVVFDYSSEGLCNEPVVLNEDLPKCGCECNNLDENSEFEDVNLIIERVVTKYASK